MEIGVQVASGIHFSFSCLLIFLPHTFLFSLTHIFVLFVHQEQLTYLTYPPAFMCVYFFFHSSSSSSSSSLGFVLVFVFIMPPLSWWDSRDSHHQHQHHTNACLPACLPARVNLT
ncbi:hypothetical protein B0T26DRAFT_362196 [Lasiosphaeria miniovina]|uniref:Uncharacterized protein n=1 Tax=Lasiosphaeria miniovina TaxID=1954250 RepID=A0AA40DRY1_9PEZI|nr:uncharacterized protein B0T26DRAFT_362196 [Lasiosphaeria miniovina]KAK0713330.1 hypothetical protein B0T26DRAFT_362196 [Lasiosphaeria miniovina]